ncbi:FOG: Transposon-encoded proteins with TYA, reverse transcriptase, integrase domains in various combinations [Plasmopara halstedii]|uniref:FOG: Transposon-encoded proteins with TYA, reverse transcriptase, integrase domains in various combinations n=1 Tax=Plasmopara halstedii TaxID=4781 RepID=A0A0P1AAM7_PLAHL|nr:FOG: Transposon-encoded proteins with TYA, reverse transcriptase, integrase domains in various combinations [Plasmopara halstedii]CEG37910.1 FOG: Transposon-encoded proteins with TYA, reverse transcriptase, integrase domains in various combinations [Plasmopara halstedii]|eukprot:XP_024574279.1 FOG: Transposon-encoded proteins with TYA, reverse transcriptase, integrase domains in various combinations [Plasmopara halstedii]
MKIKERSPSTLQEAIEMASNFEFAHHSEKPPRVPSKLQSSDSGHRPSKTKQQNLNRSDKMKGKSDDWTKAATCNNCGVVRHISPQCTQPKRKEARRYMSGTVYAILKSEARASRTKYQERSVSIFIDNDSSLNGVTEELVQGLNVTVGGMMQIDLGYDQVVHRSRQTIEMSLQLPGCPLTTGTFQVMPVPEGKDVVLSMMWLRVQNSNIDRNTGRVSPRIKVESTEAAQLKSWRNCPARSHGVNGQHGSTKLIATKQFEWMLRRDKDIGAMFVVSPHDSEKAERFKSQVWEALKNILASETLRKYAYTVCRTELSSETPPVRDGIEHDILPKPGTTPISVKQWRRSPDQRKTILERTKEKIQAGIIRPSTSAFCAPTFCVKKPVGWRIVHDYRQLNLATVLPAILMPRKKYNFDAMAGSYWYSCMDLLWGYYQVKLRESDTSFTAFRLQSKGFRDLRDVMRIYFKNNYVYTESEVVNEHFAALDDFMKRCEA